MASIDYEAMVGTKNNKLTIVKYLGKQKGKQYFIAECECGGKCRIDYYRIRTQLSCGCAKKAYADSGRFARGIILY